MSSTEQLGETNATIARTNATRDESEDDATSISKDDLYHLLQNSRRRSVVRYLQGREQTVKMRDVAEQVAAWEHDTTVRELTSDERQRVYIALYQSHLETLEDAGVIDYNKSRGLIDPKPRLEYVAQYVGEAPSDEEKTDPVDVWEQGYLSLSLVGSLLLVGATLGVSPFGLLSSFLVSVIILTMFSLLTIAKLTVDTSDGE